MKYVHTFANGFLIALAVIVPIGVVVGVQIYALVDVGMGSSSGWRFLSAVAFFFAWLGGWSAVLMAVCQKHGINFGSSYPAPPPPWRE